MDVKNVNKLRKYIHKKLLFLIHVGLGHITDQKRNDIYMVHFVIEMRCSV